MGNTLDQKVIMSPERRDFKPYIEKFFGSVRPQVPIRFEEIRHRESVLVPPEKRFLTLEDIEEIINSCLGGQAEKHKKIP